MRYAVKRDFVVQTRVSYLIDELVAVPALSASFSDIVEGRPQICWSGLGEPFQLGPYSSECRWRLTECAGEGERSWNVKIIEKLQDRCVRLPEIFVPELPPNGPRKRVGATPLSLAIQAQDELRRH
jgi:hypothetical protein